MNNHQLINQDSGSKEWYTPVEIIDLARKVMGKIDLDPASCAVANQTVRAAKYFTEKDDGLTKDWPGNVWLNHPFGRGLNEKWVNKAVSEFEDGHAQVCMITFNSTSEKWFKPLLGFKQCFIHGRVNYVNAKGEKVKSVTKGSVVTYMGNRVYEFERVFSEIGTVK